MKTLTLTLNSRSLVFATLGIALAAAGWLAGQGSLTPPGAPAPTMKTLAQLEPRTPISSLPYTISAPGSYYLTASLTGGAGGGIIINSDAVSLDLMGFELTGGTGNGITVIDIRRNIDIRNGMVTGWSGGGVMAPDITNGQLQRLVVFANGADGIRVGIATITGCVARANGGDGITTDAGCTVSGCTASFSTGFGLHVGSAGTVNGCTVFANTGAGLAAGDNSTVTGCTSYSNGGSGILVGDGSSIIGCAATGNADGIVAYSGCLIKDSQASFNGGDGIQIGDGFGGTTIRGCTARANVGDGIEVFNSCLVVDNLCDGNGVATLDLIHAAGIHVTGSVNRIESNHLTSNYRGLDVDNNPNFIVRNTASTNTTNYDISAGNRVGVTVIPPPGTAFMGHTGGEGVGATDPWANFSY